MSDTTAAETDWQAWQDSWDRQQEWYLPDREERFRVMLDMVEALVGPAPRVLDLACGTGSISDRLLRRFPDAVSTGVDLDPAPDHGRVDRVVVGIEPDVVVPRQAGRGPPADLRRDRRQRQHRRPVRARDRGIRVGREIDGVDAQDRPVPRNFEVVSRGGQYADRCRGVEDVPDPLRRMIRVDGHVRAARLEHRVNSHHQVE